MFGLAEGAPVTNREGAPSLLISSVRDLVPVWKAHALPAVRVSVRTYSEVGGN